MENESQPLPWWKLLWPKASTELRCRGPAPRRVLCMAPHHPDVSLASGFPVYDYELPITEEALNASIARINSQSWGPNLYGIFRSHVRNVDMWNSNDYRLELQLSIRETVCTKASGRDPFTCDFKIGPFARTAFCRSVVEVSGELIGNVTVQCHQGTSSSESMSSEEMMFMQIMNRGKWGSSRREGKPFLPCWTFLAHVGLPFGSFDWPSESHPMEGEESIED
uniref:Secreted phosphoprotein 24 n=1 Tax=Cairina moschata TaxID=8855 RepID=A0A8C3CYR0_CAIMO